MTNRPPQTQKFFRRTSKSPLHNSQILHNLENSILNYQPANYNVCMKSRVSQAPSTDRDISGSVSSIFDESFSTVKLNKYGSDFRKFRDCQKFGRNCSGVSKIIGKNGQDLKFTYIPMESMATLHTLPTTQKLITETNENNKSITIPKQEYVSLKKQVKELNEENRYLVEKEKVKINENMKLSRQIQILRKTNSNLENDVKKLKQNITQTERNLKISQINHENMKKNLQAIQYMKTKYEQNYKQLNKTVLNLESELRSVRQQNTRLARSALMKDIQIKQAQNQLNKQVKRYKSFVELSSVVDASSPKALRARSITFQQNKSPDQKQLTLKLKEPTKTNTERYNRSTQTSTPQNPQKQIQQLSISLTHSQTTIKNMDIQLQKLTSKTKQYDNLLIKLHQSDALIQFLNDKVIYDSVLKLAAKYKYC